MTVVAEYASGLLRTTIRTGPQDGGFTWVRGPGAARPEPLHGPPPTARRTLAAVEPGPAGRGPGVRCVLPRDPGDASELHYALPGRSSMAELLLSGAPSAAPSAQDTLYGLGRLLRALHAAPLPPAGQADAACPPPATWRRLRTWFDAPRTERAGQLHGSVRALLGEARWSSLERWLTEVREAGPLTLVHGAPGLGLLVVAEAPDHPHGLITGEDVGHAPWQWDVGWVIAELRELRFFSARLPSADTDWDRLTRAFTDGYGRTPDALVRRSTVLRSLLHLHDFSVFVAWDEAEIRRYAVLIADLMDEQEGVR
ncbi:phosphotransferase [Streptomyces sp. S.PNR 29]|uniref:phosphotransferase n=1 Tax=Streptomyces sp. S.PNR 29 TaxID=2973805 RepID=UPI0025B05733|nr:phosphotransferase [Streptomyces sp. S.PNR 29]MDN0193995.1 aminoglycoside phosphotransferase family protein [Streptomyces sp. S.PNR 29]